MKFTQFKKYNYEGETSFQAKYTGNKVENL